MIAACLAASALLGSAEAGAQSPPLNESIVIGAWTFRPSLEARLRGEYRNDPFGFDRIPNFYDDAVQLDAEGSTLPPIAGGVFNDQVKPLTDAWAISERVRLGLAVDRGPVTAVLKLQDGRVLGGTYEAAALPRVSDLGPGLSGAPGYGFAPYEAYLDIHARTGRPMFLRVGRQAVQWGDGRLIGTNDFTATGRSLDAARFGVELGDFDIEAMAVLLSLTSSTQQVSFENLEKVNPSTSFLGAQLYGLKVTGHFLPLLQIEATGLARIVRTELTPTLTPSDTFVADLRVFGGYRGVTYSVEAAYQGGQVASYGANRPIEAIAVAGRLEWETALPLHLTFGLQGAYATGDNGVATSTDKMTRFDPILPDQTSNHSRMSLYAWSNVAEAGGDLAIRPSDTVRLAAGYHYVGLADPKGRWITGALNTVGADPTNTSAELGHEVDATLRVTPWDPISFQAGYGLFLLGEGGKNILTAVERPHGEMQHWGYLQATVTAP